MQSLRPSDLLRPSPTRTADTCLVLAVASLPVFAWSSPPEQVLRGLLLCGTLVLARDLVRDPALRGRFGVALLGATWVAAVGGYTAVPAAATVAHVALPALGALVLCHVVQRTLSSAAGAPVVLAPVGVLLAVSFGLASAGAWELYEWAMCNSVLRGTIGVDYDDTVGDLALGALGGVLAGARGTGRLERLTAAIPRPAARSASGRPGADRTGSGSRR